MDSFEYSSSGSFYLYRCEVLMPDDTWLSFLLTQPHRHSTSLMVERAYPEAKDIKVTEVTPR